MLNHVASMSAICGRFVTIGSMVGKIEEKVVI